MKLLRLLIFILLVAGCKNDDTITPDTIRSIEYGVLVGFVGEVSKITVFPEKQVYQPSYTSPKTCEKAITSSEWNQLTQLFSEQAFKNVKVGEATECPDAGSSWITVRSSRQEIKAVWGPCTGGDPGSILSMVSELEKRMQAMQLICK